MKQVYLFLMIWLLVVPAALAHKISIKGKVYGKGTNTPLVGATVKLSNTPKVSTTDILGIYTFADVAEGTYEINVSYLGYEQSISQVEVKNDAVAQVMTHLEAGSLQLSEVSVSANQEKPLSLISAIDLQVRPMQSSQDILRLIPGLFIAQHAGGGKSEQIFLRGFDIDHGTDINLTADGMPVNMVSHAHGQGYADLHFLIPETIQQVDFGKGPYQADKGNFATAGYADFRTRGALSHNSLKLEAGSFNTYRALGMFNLLGEKAKEKQQHAYLATEYLFSNGYFNLPQNLNRLNIFGRYQGIFKGNTIVNASVSAFRSHWDASGQIPERAIASGQINRFGAIDSTEGGQTARYNANISVEKTLRNNATLMNQAYYVNYDFELYSNFTFFLNDPINGDEIKQKENRHIIGYQGSYQQEIDIFGKRVNTEAGIGFRYDRINGSELSRIKDRQTFIAPIRLGNTHELNTFAYLSQTWELATRLSMKGALRFDRFNFEYASLLENNPAYKPEIASGNRISPKLNINYAYSPTLQIYLNSGLGFHSNDTRVSVTGENSEVLPVAKGTDLGITFKPTSRLLINSAFWLLDLEQELVYVGDEGIVEPSGRTRRYGLDFSARYQFNNYLFADADLNLAKPRAREAEGNAYYIPLAPTFTSTGGLTYNLPNKLQGSIRYRYLSDRAANEDYSLTAKGYLLLDAVAAYTYKKLEFKLSAENILNTNWKEAQFATESQLRGETASVTEIHFTPGTPFFMKAGISYNFQIF